MAPNVIYISFNPLRPVRPSTSVAAHENRVRVWMQMTARAALSSRKMRCASRTWRVKTAVWSYGVTYSLSPPRGRKATCPYTELGTGVYACLSAVHRCDGGAHARRRWRRKRRKFSWQPAFGRDRERRASECSARGAESNLRSHQPCMQMPRLWGMPSYLPLSSRSWLSPLPLPLCRPSTRAEDASHRRARTYRAAPACSLFYPPGPGYFTADNGLRGLNAVVRTAKCLRDIET